MVEALCEQIEWGAQALEFQDAKEFLVLLNRVVDAQLAVHTRHN